MFVAALQQHPFLRLLLPLVIGIVCGDAFPHAVPISVCIGSIALLTILLPICFFTNWKYWFGACLFLLIITIGFTLTARQVSATTFPVSNRPAVYQVTINQTPERKARSVLCPAVVTFIPSKESTLTTATNHPQVLLYLQPDSISATLKRGDRLWIHARIAPPSNKGIPHEFDYARFLQRRGISGTSFIPSGYWQKTGHDSLRTFRQKAADQQEKIVSLYRKLGFQGDELAILSALTVGDKDELSEEMIETYSKTGASHVLALSGLHIGFLYALLWFLTAPIWKRLRFLKLPLLTLIIILLWGFAFLTGLSPSVVRSVCMFSIPTLSHLQPEKAISANTLAATAFFMLIIHPMWLFDVGFQLSFAAVTSILMFYSKLNRLCQSRYWLIRKIWSLMSVSIAAQIGTAPLVIFYFARFSTHFLFTNLWVIPMVSLILYAAIFLLLLTPFEPLQTFMAPYIGKLIQVQNSVLQQTELWPYASIDHLYLDANEVFLLYLTLLLFYRFLKFRIPANAYALLSALLIFGIYRTTILVRHTPSPGIAFYNISDCPSVHCLSNGPQSWLVCSDSIPRTHRLCQSLAPHWNSMGLNTPLILTQRYDNHSILLCNNILTYKGKRICLLNDDRWNKKTAAHPLPIDILYISHGYQGGIKELTSLFRIQTVILDGSLSNYSRKIITTECLQLGIGYRLLDQEGYIHIPLK